MHKDGYYSSGEFAKKSNVSVRTIRYYDQQNILKPSLLTDEGVRFYTDSDFTRLQQILLLKYLGFTLDDIRNMTIGDSDYHVLKNSLELQKRMIQDKIAQMQLVCKAIEETEDSIKEGKGKPPLNKDVDLWKEYLNLWRQWSGENIDLLRQLYKASYGVGMLTDMFATTPVNQARALATILNEKCGYFE